MYKELLYVRGDIEPSPLKAQNDVLGTNVVRADQLAVVVNEVCPA